MEDPRRTEEKETGRVEAFSDGVLAIAITLLILEIKVPKVEEVAEAGLSAKLLGLWPRGLSPRSFGTDGGIVFSAVFNAADGTR
jgi:transmembrane protein TMEM174 (potassium channel)